MKNLMIGIISWLPDDEIKRVNRKEYVQKQHEFLTNFLKINSKDIICVAQNYKKEDNYLDYNYIKIDEGIGPSKARNIILDKFYNSDYDYLLCLDDDIIFYDYYNIKDLIHEIDDNSNRFYKLDMITGVYPKYYPFKKNNQEDPNILTHYTFIPREINTPGSFTIIRNINKTYNKKIFYREMDLFKFEGREDMTFLVDWLKSGLNAYTCKQLILKDFGDGYSTLFSKDKDKYKEEVLVCMNNFLKLHDIKRDLKGNIQWKDFNKVYNKSKAYETIIREHSLTFLPEELKIKSKINLKGGLF